MKTSTERILNLCQPYINQVTDMNLLSTQLLQFAETINDYFYELYLCEINQEINALPEQMDACKNILMFFKHKMVTKRCNQIDQLETDWWPKTHSDVGVMPKISKYRFPFRMLASNPLKNILGE